MDVIGGLTAAKLALDLVKDLREIDRSVDEATFKLKLAELTSALADTKVALSDARITLQERDEESAALKTQLDAATKGDVCQKCLTGRLRLNTSRKYSYAGLGMFGVEERIYLCQNADCGFEVTTLHDPHGAIPKAASKR